MLYSPLTNSTTTTPTITGRNLAHSLRTKSERAFIGGDLHLDRLQLISPTVKQCAVLTHTCAAYVAAAVAIADDEAAREVVLSGRTALLDAAKPERLVEHFARSSPAEWLEAARAIGPAVIWDRMIAPII